MNFKRQIDLAGVVLYCNGLDLWSTLLNEFEILCEKFVNRVCRDRTVRELYNLATVLSV